MPAQPSADELRQQGNEHYRLRQFRQALHCYSSAVQLDPLAPVPLGNRSAAHFELGDYPAAIADILAAFQLMAPEDRTLTPTHPDSNTLPAYSSPLYAKLVKRLLQAQMHSLHPDDWRFEFEFGRVQLTDADERLVAEMKERHAPGAAESGPGLSDAEAAGATQLLQRCILHDHRSCEYFPVGHDQALSLIGGRIDKGTGEELPHTRIPLHALSGAGRFSALLAGVGDGRHALVTLADLYDQQQQDPGEASGRPTAAGEAQPAEASNPPASPPEPPASNAKLHLLLNDLNATAIARLLLLLLDIKRLAAFPDVHDRSDPALVRRLYAVTTSYVGVAVHRDVFDELRDTIALCAGSEAWYLEQLPFLRLRGGATGPALRHVFQLWGQRMASLSLEDTLRWYDSAGPDKADGLSTLQAPGMKEHMLAKEAENTRKQTDSLRQQMDDLSDEQVDVFLDRAYGAADPRSQGSAAQKRGCLRQLLEQHLSDPEEVEDICSMPGPALLADNGFLQMTKLLRPPAELPGLPPDVAEDIRHVRAYVADRANRAGGAFEPPTLAAAYVHDISRPNPCMVDFDFYDLLRGQLDRSFNAVTVAKAICQSPHLHEPRVTRDLYDLFGSVFWRAGRALAGCDVTLELDVGDVNALAQELLDGRAARAAAGLPTHFHRITASNIPDYCGLLPALLTLTPLLAQQSQQGQSACDGPQQPTAPEPTGIIAPQTQSSDALGPSLLKVNVLLNTGIWRNYRQYVFSSTMLAGPEEAERLLGLRLCPEPDLDVWDDFGGLWQKHQVWALQQPAAEPDRQSVLQWLHRLLLGIAYPAPRTVAHTSFELSPMSLNCLLLAVRRLRERGTPAHWLAAFLTDVLSDEPPRSCVQLYAAPPAASPNPVSALSRRASDQPVAPVRAELSALLALWTRRFPPGSGGSFVGVRPALLPADVARFVVKLSATPWTDRRDICHGYSPCLCLLLCPMALLPLLDDDCMLFSTFSGERRFAYRQHLLCSRRCRDMHVFSALRWVAPRSYTFVASAALIAALTKANSHFAVLLRLDDWSPFSMRGSLERSVKLYQPVEA